MSCHRMYTTEHILCYYENLAIGKETTKYESLCGRLQAILHFEWIETNKYAISSKGGSTFAEN
jgi:hypothetical protein